MEDCSINVVTSNNCSYVATSNKCYVATSNTSNNGFGLCGGRGCGKENKSVFELGLKSSYKDSSQITVVEVQQINFNENFHGNS